MRKIDKLQQLTTGRVDQNNNQVRPDIIDWSMFDQNPVLLYDRKDEGHRGVVVGRVEDRVRTEAGWAGKLVFMERVEDADIAFEKYTQGFLPYVSIGGYAVGGKKVEAEVYVPEKYYIREVSLVRFPANLDARILTEAEVQEENIPVVEGEQVRYLTMSFNPEAERLEAERLEAERLEAERLEAERLEAERLEAERKGMPLGFSWFDNNNKQTKNEITMKNFRELNADVDFQKRLQMLSAALRSGAPKTDGVAENAETIKLLATSMLQDKEVVLLASVTHYTDAITRKRVNALGLLIEAAAGNATAATLAAADLGVIKYLSIFYQKLLANDTFRRSLSFVPMSDKAGAIYIEDAIAAPTYIGNNTPLNATVYTYDDIKRTIARKVFAMSPVLFQHSELAILSYDKQSKGIQSAMAQLMQDVSTYVLQVVANTTGVSVVRTTGSTVSAAGLFPIEAPLSTLTIKKPTLADIITLEGKFLMQNYNFGEDGKRVEVVLPANVYSMLASDSEVRNQLTRELSANIASKIDFSASRITPRNPVARFNNTSGLMELDPAMYADKNVADDGSFTDITPATTTVNHIGAGVAFVENEVLAGFGSIELSVAPDPRNYGTLISGWLSTGVTVARSGGKGAAVIVPGV